MHTFKVLVGMCVGGISPQKEEGKVLCLNFRKMLNIYRRKLP